MNRQLFKLAWFLILGAIVNVAVAWGCAWPESDQLGLRFPSLAFASSILEATEVEVGHFVKVGWSRTNDSDRFIYKVNIVQETYPGYAQQYYYETNEPRPGINFTRHLQRNEAFAVHVQAGWPLWCLEGDVWFTTYPYNSECIQDPIGIVKVGDNHLLPIRIVWRGIAINTIFYAALLWLLTLGPFTARRMIRRKRGRCIKCGYDLRGTPDLCPECGWGREAEA